MSSIQHYFYKLKDDISKNVLESLDDEVNDLLEYCKDKNIEIVYDNYDYENKDDNNDDKTNKNKEKPKNVK